MRNKILKSILILSGVICLYGLLAIRFLPLYNFVASDKLKEGYWDYHKYGELYYYGNIKHFREDMPTAMKKFQFKKKHPKLHEAKILTFGDSYLDWSEHTQLSERLQDSLDVPVFFEYTTDPLYLLAKNQYINNQEKFIIYERTERWIPITFGKNTHLKTYEPSSEKNAEKRIFIFFQRIRDFFFEERTDELLKSLISRSYIISDINSFISTLKFDLFGYISSYTPVYSLNQEKPWLFFHDQVNDDITSFYYNHSNKEIINIANNIEEVSDELQEKYNLKLIMMIIPSKFTMHHHLVDTNASYNNFIPRLQSKLKKRSINFVDLYTSYSNSEHDMYYGTDDHWTEEGVKLSTAELIKKINELKAESSLEIE